MRKPRPLSSSRSTKICYLVVVCVTVVWLASLPTLTTAKKKSLYDTLGVPRGCPATDLKKAYRKQCLKTHPDKPGGNAEAFKEVNRAYDILSDDAKRQAYDAYGEAALDGNGDMPSSPPQQPFYGGFGGPGGSGMGGGTSHSFFSSFGGSSGTGRDGGMPNFSGFNFGGMDFGGATSRNSDTGGLNLNLEELLRQMAGGPNTQQQHPGSGGLFGMGGPPPAARPPPKSYTRTCACTLEELATGATKKMKVTFGAQRSKIYTVQLQKGWKAGTKVKFNPSKDGRFGAMTFVVQEKKHPFLERRGDDLVYRHDLNTSKQTHGASSDREGNTTKVTNTKTDGMVKIDLVLPDGEKWMRSLSKSSSFLRKGQTLTVTGKGMPIKGGPSRGNLIIEFFDSSTAKTNNRGGGDKATAESKQAPPKAKQQPS